MKRLGMKIILVGLAVCFFSTNGLAGEKIIKMSTTTSTQASGLLDVVLPELEKDTGIQVKVIAKGTGAAIRDGKDGNVDVIFVHAKAREEKFVQEGFGTRRYAVMHNDFVILGPQKDSAGIKELTNGSPMPQKRSEKLQARKSLLFPVEMTAARTPKSRPCGNPPVCRWKKKCKPS
jgi:tungstate transport system substrate-binding protein